MELNDRKKTNRERVLGAYCANVLTSCPSIGTAPPENVQFDESLRRGNWLSGNKGFPDLSIFGI